MRDEKPPSTKDTLYIWARRVLTPVVASGHLLRQWGDSESMGNVRGIRGTGSSGRCSLLVDFREK